MSKVKQYLEIISAECDECGGAGFVFWGNENDTKNFYRNGKVSTK